MAPNSYYVERLDPPRFPLAKQFYKQAHYHSHVGKEDEVYVLRDKSQNNRIIAAVRLVKSDQYLILRSMVVLPTMQGKGVGSFLLNEVDEHIDRRECWCFPFEWLESFYSGISFEVMLPDQAPAHIAESFRRYLRQGRKLKLMKRAAL
jgi:N-acetylglutamate synthase-like GNAT family acetyltransferase